VAATIVFVLGATWSAGGTDGLVAVQTPQEALGLLKAGNDRFVRNTSRPVALGVNRRQELAAGQRPIAMVLSCADSRVPPEHVFNVGLGELFVIRTAGEVVDRSILATLEYGAEHLRIPLLVVMGHESCGAVIAAADAKGTTSSANMAYLLKAIQAARRQPKQEREEIKTLILANVEQVVNDAIAGSPLLQNRVETGQLGMVGAYYELVSGRVAFSELIAPAARTSQSSAAPAARASQPTAATTGTEHGR
jgi:carbonic anhydrase